MKIRWYVLAAGRLEERPAPASWTEAGLRQSGESWFELQDPGPGELVAFLAPLGLHPLQLARCVDEVGNPGVVSFGSSLLMEYPTALGPDAARPAYLTILLHDPVLVTVRHGCIAGFDEFLEGLLAESAPHLQHLPQLIYLILDQLADQNIEAQIAIRDRIPQIASAIAERPAAVQLADLGRLREQVEMLASLVESQLYCIYGLSASDNTALQAPHRKAYIQDLVSEMENAQRGIGRLETRVKDLYGDLQAAGSDRVEKRLRLLTIVSAVTLPLGLLTGLLGMNVGGVPWTAASYGFALVLGLMAVVVLAEMWYLLRHRWFE